MVTTNAAVWSWGVRNARSTALILAQAASRYGSPTNGNSGSIRTTTRQLNYGRTNQCDHDTAGSRVGAVAPNLSDLYVGPTTSAGLLDLLRTFGVVPEESVNALGDVAPEDCRDVLVALGHAAVGPTHELHHRALGNFQEEEHSRRSVPCIV